MTDSPSLSSQDNTPVGLIEALSEKVHEAWAAEKVRQGFADHTYSCLGSSPTQCRSVSGCTIAASMHHTDMLPYADLAENIKEYDRATVRGVLSALDDCGYAIVPKDSQP